jgi:TRAP-type mannitol/chloroaromatic compound transport system substrate-binding protein
MDRRTLIRHAGIAGVLAAGIAPAVQAQAAVRWRLASSFPKSLDTIFGSAEKMAKTVHDLSGGKFEISVHAAGELMPAFGVVDAVQNGTIEMAQTAPYYFTGKDPIFAFGCAVPFGLNARQMDSWMEHGNGRKLLDEFYGKYNIKSASAGNTGTQMGGWFRKEIKTVADLKGLKMRMGGGLFGEAMAKLGVGAQNMPAGVVGRDDAQHRRLRAEGRSQRRLAGRGLAHLAGQAGVRRQPDEQADPRGIGSGPDARPGRARCAAFF